jgi:ATP-dependent helicase HrpB
MASAVDRAWLDLPELAAANLRSAPELLFHPSRGQVEARLRTTWLDLVLDQTPVPIADAAAAAEILAREAATRLDRLVPGADTAAGGFRARVHWLANAVPELGLSVLDDAVIASLLPELCRDRRSLDELRQADWLSAFHAAVGHATVAEIERLAPAQIELPTGKRHRLSYEAAGPPVLAVRIQELFGVRDTPRVAAGRVPVVLHLLGPNHRPQQVTSDLAGFWTTTYPSVKKELRRRYPKHAWPDDPLAARR